MFFFQSGNTSNFGSFQMADRTAAPGGGAGDVPADPQDSRGMKRKLFSEQFGPQEL